MTTCLLIYKKALHRSSSGCTNTMARSTVVRLTAVYPFALIDSILYKQVRITKGKWKCTYLDILLGLLGSGAWEGFAKADFCGVADTNQDYPSISRWALLGSLEWTICLVVLSFYIRQVSCATGTLPLWGLTLAIFVGRLGADSILDACTQHTYGDRCCSLAASHWRRLEKNPWPRQSTGGNELTALDLIFGPCQAFGPVDVPLASEGSSLCSSGFCRFHWHLTHSCFLQQCANEFFCLANEWPMHLQIWSTVCWPLSGVNWIKHN